MVGTDTINSNRETNFEVESNGKIFDSTIQSTKCHLLIAGRHDRCGEFSKHRLKADNLNNQVATDTIQNQIAM